MPVQVSPLFRSPPREYWRLCIESVRYPVPLYYRSTVSVTVGLFFPTDPALSHLQEDTASSLALFKPLPIRVSSCGCEQRQAAGRERVPETHWAHPSFPSGSPSEKGRRLPLRRIERVKGQTASVGNLTFVTVTPCNPLNTFHLSIYNQCL